MHPLTFRTVFVQPTLDHHFFDTMPTPLEDDTMMHEGLIRVWAKKKCLQKKMLGMMSL